MFKKSLSTICICSRPWKQCINKQWSNCLNKDAWYTIPYTVGMAELGYEYDFINNKRIKCLKTVGHFHR